MSETIEEALEQTARATAEHRALRITQNILVNLEHATLNRASLQNAGGLVYVVGAGASLDVAMPHMELASQSGTIVAVNSAGSALAANGVRIDMLVCIESLPLGHQILAAKDTVQLVALDLAAHPDNWAAALSLGVPVTWFLDSSVHNLRLCKALGTRPVYSGSSAMTSAIALALEAHGGLALVGADVACPGGNTYAKGTAWDGLKYEQKGDKLVFTGREDRDALHKASGLPAIPRLRTFWELPAWGGEGTVPSTLELIDQLKWIESRAAKTTIINTSELGARITGTHEESFTHWPPTAVIGGMMGNVYGQRAGGSIDDARALLLKEIECVKRVTEHWLNDAPLDVDALVDGTPYAHTMSVSDFLRMDRTCRDMPGPERLRARYVVLKAAAEEMERLLG